MVPAPRITCSRTGPSRWTKAAASLLAFVFTSLAMLPFSPLVEVSAAVVKPMISAGSLHSLAVDAAGNVWAFGDNTQGQLGDGTTTRRYSPIMAYAVTSGRKAVAVAAGDTHSLVLMSDGSVWAFGSNTTNALSTNSSSAKILSPSKVRLQTGGVLTGVLTVSAGGSSSAALLKDGTARVWGKGLRPTSVLLKSSGLALTGLVGISVGSTQIVLVKSDGTVYACDAATPGQAVPVQMRSGAGSVALSGIASVSAGKGFAVAVSKSGQLYSFGSNASGVLGRDTGGAADDVADLVLASAGGSPLSGVQSVECGPDHVVAVLAGGSLYGWGLAENGRLGTSQTGTVPYPVSLGLAGVNEISTGGRHILARSSVGVVWAFGANGVGQADGESSGTLDPHVVTMTTRIWRTTTPTLKAANVTETTFSLTWRSQDLFEDNVKGFIIRWSLPDGTSGETIQLPATVRGVVLGGLVSGTNHTVRVVAIGSSGAAEEAPPLVVQTRPAVSPSISPDVTPSTTGSVTPDPSLSGMPTPVPTMGGEDMANAMTTAYRNVLNTVLLGAISLAVLALLVKVLIWNAAHRDLTGRDD